MQKVISNEIAQHALSEAYWIWPSELGRPINTYLEFRHEFNAPAQSEMEVQFLIAADTVYALWLNGALVETARFPDVPPTRQYDCIPLKNVTPGKNTIIVGLHVQGIPSHQHIPGDPGLIFAIVGAEQQSGSGGATQWRLDNAYQSGDMPKTTRQLGFSHAFDARTSPGEWRAILDSDLMARGDAMELWPRPIKRSTIVERIPTRIIAQGYLAGGDRIPTNPSDSMQHDFMAAREFGTMFGSAASPVLPADNGIGLVHETVDGIYMIIDLGSESTGYVTLELLSTSDLTIDIGHGEHLDDLRVRAMIGGRNFANRFSCGPGRHLFTHWYKRIGGRYLQLNIRGAQRGFKLFYAGILPVLYPVVQEGSFSSANRCLDDIFSVSAHTLHLCMHEHYEDTPWREQALYANDSRNQALAGYYVFGERDFPAASFELLGKGLGKDGWLELCMPSLLPRTIPSFSFCWILAIADHWLYCGDRQFVINNLDTIERILKHHISELRDGLIPTPVGERYVNFYDWMPGLCGPVAVLEKGTRFDAPLNLFFLLALQAALKLAEDFDLSASSASWEKVAGGLFELIHNRFWDCDERAYLTYSGDNAPRHFCDHTQALALLTKELPAATAGELRTSLHGGRGWVEPSLSQSLYKYTAMLQGDSKDQAWAFRSIETIWSSMLRSGATSFWETQLGADDFNGGGSLCHGWSGIPAYIFGAYLLGIRPVAPGFAKFVAQPMDSDIETVEGTVPTPYGPIRIRWSGTGAGHRGVLEYPATLDCLSAENFPGTVRTY